MYNINMSNLPILTISEYGDEGYPPLLFVGGWGVSTESYAERLEHLGQRFKVYSISLPGFGENEPLDFWNNHIRGQSDYIRGAVEEIVNRHERLFLMGHSTGAAIATFLANYFPEKVTRLVLVSPIGSPDPLSKSFIRMLRAINVKEVLKYSTAQYRRRAISNIRLGIEAKYLDLSPHLKNAKARGVEIDLFLADNDLIAPPGKLVEIEEVSIFWVEGGHAWFKYDRTVILGHLSQYVEEESAIPIIDSKRSVWLKLWDILFSPVKQTVRD
jgi:pimeloyl-ACP methyl ester carboxylesterase